MHLQTRHALLLSTVIATSALACPPATLCLDDNPFSGISPVISFSTGSASLDNASKANLDKLAEILINPNVPSVLVRLIGHTDATGSAAANLALSQARADAVKNWIVLRGVAAARIYTSGLGDTQPVSTVHSAKAYAKNRRVVISLISE